MNNPNCVNFFFGRFQPPHSGHFDIIERTIANNSSKCKIFIFISPKTSRDDINSGSEILAAENQIGNVISRND